MSGIKNAPQVKIQLDEADNMLFVLTDLAQKRAIDTNEAVRRFKEIRSKLKFVADRVSLS